MSKKKPTPPLPLTGVITITTDGRSTLAMKATHRGEDIEVSTGMANCRPGDVYSEYEGARIALARLYGVDPFPECVGKDDAPQEKGHWEKATRENCQKGARVRVVAAKYTEGAYQNGDQGILQDTPPEGRLHHIIFDGRKAPTAPGCCLSELEVWVPDAPEAPKPPAPSFRVGDIVRLGEGKNVFASKLRGKVGRVFKVSETPDPWEVIYTIVLNGSSRGPVTQVCSEWSGHPAPLELVYREPEKGGEKA